MAKTTEGADGYSRSLKRPKGRTDRHSRCSPRKTMAGIVIGCPQALFPE